METKVADLTIDELREIIRGVLTEYLDPDGDLKPEMIIDLRQRNEADEWVDHDSVWGNE
ncbi:MAG: hypothetical protein HQ568_05465 [Calditrichaeota bacterium]|nr:hypothetical protein [Calditrichota bacterium]